ncbi:hypothetical protein AAGG74_18425 [Bacillus mexicanus]|uniref:hypothetical protein n=1 Tax=Bacillus mexicanus TaxID=2834415 RepID=UPI003D1FB8D2
MLNFIKNNKALVSIFSIVLISLFIVTAIFISYIKNDQKVEKAKIESFKDDEGKDNGTLHDDYIPNIEVPFDGSKDSYTISDFVLGNPDTFEKATTPGAGAVLNGGVQNNGLISSYGGYLYLYNFNKKSSTIIDKFTTYGNMNDNGKYVFYSKYVDAVKKEEDKQNLIIFDTETNKRTNIGELDKGMTVKSSAIYDALVFYNATDLTEATSNSDVLKTEVSIPTSKLNQYKTLLSKYNFTKFKVYDDKLFAFDKNTSSIYELSNGKAALKSKIPTKYLLDYAISGSNIFINYTDLENSYYTINGRLNTKLSSSTYPIWIDNNNLMLIIDSNLQIYNVKKNKLYPVLSGVSVAFSDSNKIYLQDGNEDSYLKTIKILNR